MRTVLYLFFFHFGVDFWLFPNMFIDSDAINPIRVFAESFWPLLEVSRRQDDQQMFILRGISAIGLTYLLYQMSQEPQNIDDIVNLGQGFDDLFDWGHERFVLGKLGEGGNSTAAVGR